MKNPKMEESKIGLRDLAIKLRYHYKHNITLNAVNQWHRHAGPFSRVEHFNEGVTLDLCFLCLENPDQPMRSCKYELKQIHGIDMSEGIISQWFRRNKQFKGVFVKTTCAFSYSNNILRSFLKFYNYS